MLQNENDALNSTADRIALMTLYRDEWKYRDQTFKSGLWRFVYLSLIITFLPNFLETINTNPEIVNALPSEVFPILGIACSFFGLYVGLANVERITSIDEVYRRLSQHFKPDERVKIYEESYLKVRLNALTCIVLYGTTIILAIINLIFILHNEI